MFRRSHRPRPIAAPWPLWVEVLLALIGGFAVMGLCILAYTLAGIWGWAL